MDDLWISDLNLLCRDKSMAAGKPAATWRQKVSPSFENMFVVKNYETGPITLYVQWAPQQQLDETIIVPLTEA